ncbi:F-box protein: endocytic membrane traffic, recycling ReCYcling 1 [Saitoella coloradoensis]
MTLRPTVLPAEILSGIVDYLPVPDLAAVAQVNKQLREMVYDDTRWGARLRQMGVWDEKEAKRKTLDALEQTEIARKRIEAERQLGRKTGSVTLFDATIAVTGDNEREVDVAGPAAPKPTMVNPSSYLTVFEGVRSVRGYARVEFARIYEALAPLYNDLANASDHTEPLVFRMFRTPEEQAMMINILQKFGRSRSVRDWSKKETKIAAMIDLFESAALQEFEGGYDARDVDGRMKRYANVLTELNGGASCVQLFIQKNPLMYEIPETPTDCFVGELLNLEPMSLFITRLINELNIQSDVVNRTFPESLNVMLTFAERVIQDVVADYTARLIEEAHQKDTETFLKAVCGSFQQCLRIPASLTEIKGSKGTLKEDTEKAINAMFEVHVDLYLVEELNFVRNKCEAEVESWERKVAEDAEAHESMLLSGVSRAEDKKNFLTSFKKVLLMPVSVIPFPSTTAKVTPTTTARPSDELSRAAQTAQASAAISRTGTPAPATLPTTELAAQSAILSARLEGIRGLFSLEVALQLLHLCKSSLERAEPFLSMGGQLSEEVREQCEAIFVTLIQHLGKRHIKNGFDQAVEHLSRYQPSQGSDVGTSVEPLVIFLELVHVGDLIQQMVDVFFEQEMTRLVDRNDFLNPAVKEKKRFEQLIDERVAAGLSKGIDVLMNQVEYILHERQSRRDYNPLPASVTGERDPGLGPTRAAKEAVECLTTHTKLLVGSTDKSVLDVFFQEVGVRLFGSLCKHLKKQTVNVEGGIKLISDLNHYHAFATSLRQKVIMPYFTALKELGHVFIIGTSDAKAIGTLCSDVARYGGVFRAEEVYEFVQCRADWLKVKRDVDKILFGAMNDCCVQ